MKRIIALLAAYSFISMPVLAQGRGYVAPGGAYGGTTYNPLPSYVSPGTLPYVSPGLGRPIGNPYGYAPNPVYNPYGYNPYGGGYINNYPYFTGGIGLPAPIGGGFFGLNAGGRSFNFWKAPSGYYYPWYYNQTYAAPIVIVNNGSAEASQPPLSTVFSDLLKYLDEQKAAGKISETDFTHLKQRALDLLSKERDLRTQGSGSLDSEQEREIRTDVDSLGGEIARRVKP